MSEGEIINDVVNNYALYITAVSAGVGGIIVIYRKVLKPMILGAKRYLDTLGKIDTIFEAVTPNGGTSMLDKVDIIAAKMIRVESSLHLTNERSRGRWLDAPEMMFETDTEGNCTWVNRTYARIVGRGIDELLDHGWVNTIAKEDRDRVVKEWYDAVEEHREFSLNFNFESVDGTIIPASVVSYKMINPDDGNTIGYLGTVTAI
jgi:PAS domain S-box-containing protein